MEKLMLASNLKITLACVLVLMACQDLTAGPPYGAGRSYPLVYGATGRPYGPTQANYQYQLRYGRPWHGGGHSSRRYHAGRGFAGTGYVAPYYSAGYSPIYGLNVPIYTAPNFIYSGPAYPQYGAYGFYGEIPGVPTINHVPFQNGANGNTMIGQGFQPDPFLQNEPFGNDTIQVPPIIEESNPQQLERALRLRVQGDEAFAEIDYRRAGELYQEATRVAPDQADARYRLAISLAARSRFDEAVEELKIATELDMEWPSHGVTLDELYGLTDPDDWMTRDEKNRVKTRIAEWTNRDVRDPNRLFLLAAVMMLDGDVRAKGLLETAIRLNGVERHLVAFLTPLVDATSTVSQEAEPTPVGPRVFEADNTERGFVPPAPDRNMNRGEITGEERARRVFEKESTPAADDLIPPPPENSATPIPASPPVPDEPEPALITPPDQDKKSNGPVLPPQ